MNLLAWIFSYLSGMLGTALIFFRWEMRQSCRTTVESTWSYMDNNMRGLPFVLTVFLWPIIAPFRLLWIGLMLLLEFILDPSKPSKP